MDFVSVLLIGIGLSMDAFAVSLCKGLALKNPSVKSIVVIGLWFGAFQMIMPIIGYYLGSSFYSLIDGYDHWIAFILLAAIGLNMVRESFSDEDEGIDGSIGVGTMFVLAIATSIDALAVGISLAMTGDGIFVSASIIGITTFVLSAVAVKLGSRFGDRFGNRAELLGGVILLLIGLKILLEHCGIF